MKIKVGDKIYDGAEEPIMVILTEQDKWNIAHMAPEAKKYCQYPSSMLTQDVPVWAGEEDAIRYTEINS